MSAEVLLRVMVLRRDDDSGALMPHEIAACEPDALGFTLMTLYDEGQISAESQVGVLQRGEEQIIGRWLINPWGRGE